MLDLKRVNSTATFSSVWAQVSYVQGSSDSGEQKIDLLAAAGQNVTGMQNVFELSNSDKSGYIAAAGMILAHGGDAEGLFSMMDIDSEGRVSRLEWARFIGCVTKKKGLHFAVFFVNHLARMLRLQQEAGEI